MFQHAFKLQPLASPLGFELFTVIGAKLYDKLFRNKTGKEIRKITPQQTTIRRSFRKSSFSPLCIYMFIKFCFFSSPPRNKTHTLSAEGSHRRAHSCDLLRLHPQRRVDQSGTCENTRGEDVLSRT